MRLPQLERRDNAERAERCKSGGGVPPRRALWRGRNPYQLRTLYGGTPANRSRAISELLPRDGICGRDVRGPFSTEIRPPTASQTRNRPAPPAPQPAFRSLGPRSTPMVTGWPHRTLVGSAVRRKPVHGAGLECSAGRTRTSNTWINSPLLCQLSYRGRYVNS